jgi:hypothetical protein
LSLLLDPTLVTSSDSTGFSLLYLSFSSFSSFLSLSLSLSLSHTHTHTLSHNLFTSYVFFLFSFYLFSDHLTCM